MRAPHAALVLTVLSLLGAATLSPVREARAQRPPPQPPPTARDTAARDTTQRDSTRRGPLDLPLLGQGSTLNVDLRARLEARAEQLRNERCVAGLFGAAFRCSATFQPTFDFQLNLLSSGTVGERVHVNVDYDTQREFDASNVLSLAWRGREGRALQLVEVGNVSFAPPVSRFLTAGIPSNNYGILAGGQLGNMRFSAIAAQQKGNVVRDQVFTVGDRTRRTLERAIEDYQVEPRRFFWTVDPAILGPAYPNIDLLDTRRMEALAASLPDTLRPSRVSVYRLLLGGQPRNPNGPQFRLLGDPASQRGPVYELLREQQDYYLDPSNLWFALVTPLNQNSERLVVAYTLNVNGKDTVIANVGGTPDLEYVSDRDQLAQLVWDPRVSERDPAFRREIRSFYRIGGPDVNRRSVEVRIVTGPGRDQEKPPGGSAQTYLQLFGLSQSNNPAVFDLENRLWPRPTDPNVTLDPGGAVATLMRDHFLVFPSVEPFARRGLARDPAIPANDSIYSVASEYLYAPQHPPSFYRLVTRYESEGEGATGEIVLNAVQLRPGSEEVVLEGRVLRRGAEYEMDYELGRITFLRPDTLFPIARQVRVRYEENPLFTTIPTNVFGLTTTWQLDQGTLSFTALQQTQRTTYTRPPLGFEPASSLVAGVSGAFRFDAAPLGRALSRALPWVRDLGPTTIELQGEFAVSRPQVNARGQAYVESFEGEGGLSVRLDEIGWFLSSQPALGAALPSRLPGPTLDLTRAATVAWQNTGTDRNGNAVRFTIEEIDPQAALAGTGVAPPEPMLWLTLYPLSIGGFRDAQTGSYDWRVQGTAAGRRWRSVRTALGTTGSDLTRVETIEFWTLVDTLAVRRGENPVLVLDFGEVSENTVAFAPESLAVGTTSTGAADSTFAGRRLQGFDQLDSERDPFSRAFNVDVNDTGLPGDVADRIVVTGSGTPTTLTGTRLCRRDLNALAALGDSRGNCTIGNARLDEEDLDADNVLNFPSARREEEALLRYVVDLSQPEAFNRVGRCGVAVADVNGAIEPSPTLCWVNVRLPFDSPTERLNGGPLLRRVRSLRVTTVSGAGASDDEFTTLPLARLRLLGAPWLKRADRPLQGIAGDREGSGFVIASVIGTQDRDSTRGVFYEPPPGVIDEPESQQGQFDPLRTQVNERSLRLLAGGLQRYDRAEAYFRFPEGERSFMTYREMRVWARGRGNGWGTNGDLQFFVKIGRDADNFYLYRTGANAGNTRAAWEPEVRVRFERFYALRARLQNAFLTGAADSIACTGADSALIARAGIPAGRSVTRYAACADGYIVYTTDPAVTPPNLAAVQELAVGIVRVGDGSGPAPPLPSDTLELWVDDIRLADVVNETGFAGQVGTTITAGDLFALRMNLTRRDPHFRQIGEAPTFLTNDDLELAATVRLDRLVPGARGFAVPLTISRVQAAADPLFVTRSDIEGAAVEGLRKPKDTFTTVSVGVRRSTPHTGQWFSPIVNHLALTGTWRAEGNRSEFQRATNRDFNVGVDFLVHAPREAVVPGLDAPPGDGGAPADAGRSHRLGMLPAILAAPWQAARLDRVWWRPTRFHVTSAVARDTDRRASFLKPAAALDDTARLVVGRDEVWRTGVGLEFNPVEPVTVRWDVRSVRDLRDYGDTTANGIAVEEEQGHLLGFDTGLERERRMETAISYADDVTDWLRPRADFTSRYGIFRDPNARTLLDPSGDAPARLPRRLGNEQSLSTGVLLDLRRLAARFVAEGSLLGRMVRVIDPVDVALQRSVLSSYDGTAASPNIGYQFGIGGADDFRRLGGDLAAATALSNAVALTHTISLPFNVSVQHRAQHATSRNWARRGDDALSAIDATTTTWPDVGVRWAATAPLFGGFVESANASARAQHTEGFVVLPTELLGRAAERRATRQQSYPVSLQLGFGPGGIQATAGYTWSERVDSLPGSVTSARSRDLTADLGRSFRLPARWKTQSDLRARITWQQSDTRSFVSNRLALVGQSRLTDNGRQSISLNADTDLSETLTFSLQGARVVNFDRNFNRRFTQTLLSAVMQLRFFGGAGGAEQ